MKLCCSVSKTRDNQEGVGAMRASKSRQVVFPILLTVFLAGGGLLLGGTALRQSARAAVTYTYGDVVISEIMYDPAGAEPDTEWVELYNPGSVSVDVGGWVLSDTEGSCTIPAGTTIAANGFLVVSQAALPDITGEVVCTPSGPFELSDGTGIGTPADELALFTSSGERVFGSLVMPYPDMDAGSNAGNSIGLTYPMAGWSSDTADWATETTVASGLNYAHHTAGAANDGWSGYVATNHTITANGTVDEWEANGEQLGSADGVVFYLTWDADYIYVGMVGGNTASDKYNVLIDTDPLDEGAANSGNTSEYCGATFSEDGKADYAIQLYPTGTAHAQADGTNWNAWSPSGSGGHRGTGQVEFYIRKSDLGLTSSDPVGFYLYACNSGNRVWASWPPENEVDTSSVVTQTTRVVFENTLPNRSPRYEGAHVGCETRSIGVTSSNTAYPFFDDAADAGLSWYARMVVDRNTNADCQVRVKVNGNRTIPRLDGSIRRGYEISPNAACDSGGLHASYLYFKFEDGSAYNAPSELRGHSSTNLDAYHWNGTSWDVYPTTTYLPPRRIRIPDISDFSPWTMADANVGESPTAVTLRTFRGKGRALPVGLSLGLLLGLAAILAGVRLYRQRAA